MSPEERRKHLAKFDPFVRLDTSCTSEMILPVPDEVTDHSPHLPWAVMKINVKLFFK